MDKVYLGKIVSTHGIKGELKILSDFPYKEKAFKVGNNIIINNTTYQINSYRVHKKYDMITLDTYNNINDVLHLLKNKVYINKEDLNLSDNEILDEELLDYKVITDKEKEGTIKEIFNASEHNKILRVEFEKEVLIPFNSPMIIKIDKENKIIYVKLISGTE